VLVGAPQVMPEEMRVTVGDLRGAPITLVPDGRILVNDTEARLRSMNIDGRPANIHALAAINPATGQPGAHVSAEHKEMLEAAGLTTWDELGMVVLATAAELRSQAHALLSLDALVHLLGVLGEIYPKLADLARARIGERRLAEVLRLLLRENVGVKNLPFIIETLFVMPPVATPIDDRLVIFASLLRPAVAGNPMPDEGVLVEMAETVRGALKYQLSQQHARGTSTLVCYLLDPKIDALLRTPGPLAATDEQRILTAINDSLDLEHLPATAQMPVFLVTSPIRARLRRIIEPWLPHAPVISFQELAPELNVQPVARISFE
jgi:type III secretion protein V